MTRPCLGKEQGCPTCIYDLMHSITLMQHCTIEICQNDELHRNLCLLTSTSGREREISMDLEISSWTKDKRKWEEEGRSFIPGEGGAVDLFTIALTEEEYQEREEPSVSSLHLRWRTMSCESCDEHSIINYWMQQDKLYFYTCSYCPSCNFCTTSNVYIAKSKNRTCCFVTTHPSIFKCPLRGLLLGWGTMGYGKWLWR